MLETLRDAIVDDQRKAATDAKKIKTLEEENGKLNTENSKLRDEVCRLKTQLSSPCSPQSPAATQPAKLPHKFSASVCEATAIVSGNVTSAKTEKISPLLRPNQVILPKDNNMTSGGRESPFPTLNESEEDGCRTNPASSSRRTEHNMIGISGSQ